MALTDGCDWEKIEAACGLDRQASRRRPRQVWPLLQGGGGEDRVFDSHLSVGQAASLVQTCTEFPAYSWEMYYSGLQFN